jgi:cytochrome c biogenesis protein CcdA
MREKELIDAGKLKGKMPKPVVIGLLSGMGMLTFFLFIGILAAAMGEAFARSGLIHYIALAIAILLLVLGFFMLTGGTAHLMGWVDRLVQKWSTTEEDDVFTPKRNMYLYGFGYAAASIDCTAAAVIPFVIYLSTLGSDAVLAGLGSLMLGLLILMMVVTIMVSIGSQVMVNFLKQATGMIKMVGSWMMMFAGIGLIIFLTKPEYFV